MCVPIADPTGLTIELTDTQFRHGEKGATLRLEVVILPDLVDVHSLGSAVLTGTNEIEEELWEAKRKASRSGPRLAQK